MQRSVRIQPQPYPNYKTSQYHSWRVDIWSSSSSLPWWFWPRYQPYEI